MTAFNLVLSTAIFERGMENLAAGRGRKEDDSGTSLGTILLRWPWMWAENVEPSVWSVKMLLVRSAVSFCIGVHFDTNLLTKVNIVWQWLFVPFSSGPWKNSHLFSFTLVSGQDFVAFLHDIFLHSCMRFSCIPTQRLQMLPSMVMGRRAPRMCGCGCGCGMGWWVQHLGTVPHMTHPPCFLVFSMEEFQELLASPPSSWESRISSFPYFATIFMGIMLRSWETMFIYILQQSHHLHIHHVLGFFPSFFITANTDYAPKSFWDLCLVTKVHIFSYSVP